MVICSIFGMEKVDGGCMFDDCVCRGVIIIISIYVVWRGVLIIWNGEI